MGENETQVSRNGSFQGGNRGGLSQTGSVCAPTLQEITEALRASRLELLGVWSDYAFSAPDAQTERWYFAARAKKEP